MKNVDILNDLKKINMKNSEFEKFDKKFNSMFKVFAVFFVIVVGGIFAVWGTIAYVAVTKGPETLQRAERVVDAYADKLEQESKNQKKP